MRHALRASAAALLTLAAAPDACLAQQPDRIDSYRVIPHRSEVVQTGGFAGFETRYRIEGEYDFVQETGKGLPGDPLVRTARFEDTFIIAPAGPMLPAFWDVGERLGLESLVGRQLPLGAPFDVYHFNGIINDAAPASPLESSRIDLYAAMLGPWMYVYGETTPPPHTADYFEYELRMLARQGGWSDWNEDGVVDAADYTRLRDQDGALAGNAPDWDTAYGDWKAHFGESAPDLSAVEAAFSAAIASAHATTIPEPTCVLLVAIGGIAALRRS